MTYGECRNSSILKVVSSVKQLAERSTIATLRLLSSMTSWSNCLTTTNLTSNGSHLFGNQRSWGRIHSFRSWLQSAIFYLQFSRPLRVAMTSAENGLHRARGASITDYDYVVARGVNRIPDTRIFDTKGRRQASQRQNVARQLHAIRSRIL